MNRTILTFYGGVNEIGGNKILLEDCDTRVLLDFGMSFTGESQYFSGYLTPRGVNGAGDYLEFDLLPKLSGLYAEDMIRNSGIKYKPPSIDGVIISHAHMDHVGYLPFIDESIPVHLGECTKTIIEAMQDSGRIDLGHHKFQTFRTGQKLRIGDLEIEPVHVDHSIPGAYGCIIHTSKGPIVYTGDFRLHGPMANMTREFAQKAGEEDPIAMVSEGTRICYPEDQKIRSEHGVKAESNRIVANTSNLVVVASYSRDIDRFKTFYEIAKDNDRKFVIPLKQAHLLWKLKDDSALKIPNVMKDDDILFYKKRKKTGEFCETDYFAWERPFLDKAVNFDYIRKNQAKVLFSLDLVAFTELIDIKPSRGGHFIHSMSEPFSEEDLDRGVLNSWLDHFGLEFHQVHASGHCPVADLQQVVNQIRPRRLMPVHTEHPELFGKLFKDLNVQVVEKAKKYFL